MEGCHCLGTRDWYLMHYSNPVITGGQKHTHIEAVKYEADHGTKFVLLVLVSHSTARQSLTIP
jgi:hypothetical protein